MIMLIGSIVLLVFSLAIVLGAFRQPATTPDQRIQRQLRIQVGALVFYTVDPWLFVFADFPGSPWATTSMVTMAVVSALFAGILLVTVTDWRGWGKRGWRSPSHPFPRDRRLRVITLIAAPLALLSDVILLIVLLSR